MIEKILPLDQKKNLNIENHHDLVVNSRKNYKTFIPQSKIIKKVEFHKQLSF